MFVVICAFLVVVPVYVAPYEVGMGVLITAIGVPFYYVGVVWKNKPKLLQSAISMYFMSILSVIYKYTLFNALSFVVIYRPFYLRVPKNVYDSQRGEI